MNGAHLYDTEYCGVIEFKYILKMLYYVSIKLCQNNLCFALAAVHRVRCVE